MLFWLSFLCMLFCKQSHWEADYAHGVHVFSRPLPVKPVVTLSRSWNIPSQAVWLNGAYMLVKTCRQYSRKVKHVPNWLSTSVSDCHRSGTCDMPWPIKITVVHHELSEYLNQKHIFPKMCSCRLRFPIGKPNWLAWHELTNQREVDPQTRTPEPNTNNSDVHVWKFF